MSPLPKHQSRGGRVRVSLLICIVIPLLTALPVWAFAWAAADPQPHDLPIGVAGPPPATAELEQQLSARDGAFDTEVYDSRSQARAAIEDREIYGAVVASDSGTELLTASAASPAVAQLLTSMFASPDAAGEQPPATVVDLVPTDADDPRGSALGSLVLPLVLVSVITALVVLLLARPGWHQIAMITLAAVLGSAVATGIAQGGLGVISGDWWMNLTAPLLTIAAIASVLVGFVSAFGRIGIAVIAPLMLFLGNPWSGASSAPELLPEPAGAIGQLMPPGAGASALRSTAFFDGAGLATPALVLGTWIAVGLLAIAYAALRRREPARELADAARPLTDALR